jgi:hypothetical protein
MNFPTRPLLLIAMLPLTGCLQDTASYPFPEKDHAITLVRNQTWFWQDTLDVEVIVIRLPECNGGMRILDVPVNTQITLYQAPDEYQEPLHLLQSGKRVLAVSAQSCRVQEFKEAPDDLGRQLGVFRVKDERFQFVPAEASASVGKG